MSRRLNPRMEEALQLMSRAPLQKTPDGWVSKGSGNHKPFCSHTILWLASRSYVRIVGGVAHIGAAGRAALRMEEYAA